MIVDLISSHLALLLPSLPSLPLPPLNWRFRADLARPLWRAFSSQFWLVEKRRASLILLVRMAPTAPTGRSGASRASPTEPSYSQAQFGPLIRSRRSKTKLMLRRAARVGSRAGNGSALADSTRRECAALAKRCLFAKSWPA